MICPGCGNHVPDGARFCPECGARLALDGTQATSTQTPLVPGQEGTGEARASRRPRHLVLIVLAIACLVALCGGAWCALHSMGPIVSARGGHPVTFVLTSSGIDDHSSRIPARITGTTADGEDYDETIFLARDGADCRLEAGEYHAEILASPIASDGTIYDLVVGEVDFTVPESLAPGKEYMLPRSQSFVLSPADPATLTDETIEECVSWARKDTDPATDADALEEAARAWRDEGAALGTRRRIQLDTETTPIV